MQQLRIDAESMLRLMPKRKYRGIFTSFPQIFRCNFDRRKFGLDSKCFVRRNFDGRKFDVISIYFLRSFEEWKFHAISMYFFDVIAMNGKSAQLQRAYYMFMKDNILWTFWYLFLINFRFISYSCRRSLSHRNQSIDLPSKLMDWFLYNRDFRHERVKKENG